VGQNMMCNDGDRRTSGSYLEKHSAFMAKKLP